MKWVDPYAEQFTEFAPGENDACGPNANTNGLATVYKRKPTVSQMLAIRNRDIATGLFKAMSGQNVYQLVSDVHSFEPTVTVRQFPALVNFDNPDYGAIHQALDAAMVRENSCVLNVGKASALPGNEAGVSWHFVLCGGYDDETGPVPLYLVYNGDESPQDNKPNWMTWAQLQAAHIAAIVEYVKQGDDMVNDWSNWAASGDGMICKTPAPGGSHPVVRGGILAMLRRNAIPMIPGDYPIAEITAPDETGYYHQRWNLSEMIYKDDQHCGYYAIGQALTNTEHQRDTALAQQNHVVSSAGADSDVAIAMSLLSAVRAAK